MKQLTTCEFKYADKQKIEDILPSLFDILHSNMSVIAPTGNTYDEDMKIWSSNIIPYKGDYAVLLKKYS